MKGAIVCFSSGVLFALGLGIAGMTQPEKVMGFLDFAGRWDASLMFVMVGAIAVNALAYHLIAKKRARPVLVDRWHLPTKKDLDRPLVLGAAIFGVGWGLGGCCPGPGLVSVASGSLSAVVFVAAMVGGMLGYSATHERTPRDEL